MDDFGLYFIITQPLIPYKKIAEICVDRGIRFIQLREKNFSDRDILIACEEIQTVIDGSNTKLIMNDRADLASLRDADGLHLGQDDLPLELAARFFNREGHIWGLSTHSVEQARVAWYHNPDYIGFGPLFSTPTKKNPDPVVGLDCLGALVKESPMPVVAIGGKFMTQMQYAQKGEITTAMEEAARFENCSPEIIREGLAEGTIVIPRNRDRHFPARAIGKAMKTKVNVNMGTSEYHCSFSEEREKLQTALDLEADSIMDLSTGPDARILLEQIINQSTVMVGTVPIHQAELGVDFMTLHCGINRKSLPFINEEDRTAGIVSRGGSLILQWMLVNDRENPLYEQYDRLLDIAEKYDITLSLGDGMRPGGQADSTDSAQVAELLVLGELVTRAWIRGVQVMVEGPGHLPLQHVAANVTLQKQLCHGAPFYVLGPLVTDTAPGYDHIAGAIGGAIAAAAGADFLCYVTPTEHLCLPDLNDVRQGLIASRIAAHSGDIAKGIPGASQRDRDMSRARKNFDWEAQFALSLDSEEARRRRRNSECNEEDFCSMCGKLCALRTNRGDNH